MKAKRSLKIFGYGILTQAAAMLLGILIPKLYIVSYGSEVNGFLSSIGQIFVYVALLEAGIATASLQALYGPLAGENHREISRILAAADRYYRKTGIFYGLAVAAIAGLYPALIHADIPFSVMAGVILLQGASGAVNYFFLGKFTVLLRADGRSYICANAAALINIVSKLIQILLVLSGFQILTVQAAYFTLNLLQLIYIRAYVKKHYGWLDPGAEPDFSAIAQRKNVMVHQIARLVFHNTDMLVLTWFCNLKVVSVYALYSMIISCVTNVIDTLCTSVEFVLGQTFHSDRQRFQKLYETYETYYLSTAFFLFTVVLLMLPSFVELYTAGITDIHYGDPWLPGLFVVLNLLLYARRSANQVINFAGHFRQTQSRAILEAGINLAVSLFLVRRIGIYGVLLGTIAALLYRTNDMIFYANRRILRQKPWRTYRRVLQNLAVMGLCTLLGKNLLPPIASYSLWILHAVWISLLCGSLFLLTASLFDRSSFRMAAEILRGFGNKKTKT